MFSFPFRIGAWQAECCACTPDVERVVVLFSKFMKAFSQTSDSTGKRYLVVASPALMDASTCPPGILEQGRYGWNGFYTALKMAYQQYQQANSLVFAKNKSAPEIFSFTWSPPLEKNHNGTPCDYFAMIGPSPSELTEITLWGFCFKIAALWHMQHGGLSMHSVGMVRGKDGFLFLGSSGRGKSTLARLSTQAGLSALGDDLNFIIHDDANGYRLAASPSPMLSSVGYSLFQPRLKGILALVQDQHDQLIPLSPFQVVRLLFDGFYQEAPYVHKAPDHLIETAFHTICDIAKNIPAFELHFRKSPEFWKLIDDQFPG